MNKKFAYTVSEAISILVILGIVILIVSHFAIGDRQKEYDAKFRKISSTITSNIEQDFIRRTGFQYGDYGRDNDKFVSVVIKNMKGMAVDSPCNNCWSLNTVDGNDVSNYRKYKAKDGSVIAIDNSGTNIFVDVNGRKGPNVFRRDIFPYNLMLARAEGSSASTTEAILPPSCGSMPDDRYTYQSAAYPDCWIKDGCNTSKVNIVDVGSHTNYSKTTYPRVTLKETEIEAASIANGCTRKVKYENECSSYGTVPSSHYNYEKRDVPNCDYQVTSCKKTPPTGCEQKFCSSYDGVWGCKSHVTINCCTTNTNQYCIFGAVTAATGHDGVAAYNLSICNICAAKRQAYNDYVDYCN